MTEITNTQQAIEILRVARVERGEWYSTTTDLITPEISSGSVTIDGTFNADELKAFIYFLEK